MCYEYRPSDYKQLFGYEDEDKVVKKPKKDTKKAEVESSADQTVTLCCDTVGGLVEAKSAFLKSMSEFVKTATNREIKVVYISSPFSAPKESQVIENVEKAMGFAIELIKKGYVPIYTHANYYLDVIAQEKGIKFSYEDGMKQCFGILERCDAMLYLGYSSGCNRELRFALDHGIPIYFSIDELEKVKS